MTNVIYHASTEAWLKKHNLWPSDGAHPDWGFKIEMSTVRPFDWVSRRSSIGENEYWLGVNVSRVIGWRVAFFPRNELFKVNWRDTGMDIESEQLRFRELTKWPAMDSLDDLPDMVAALQRLLSFTLHSVIIIRALSLKVEDVETLRIWLQSVGKNIVVEVVELHGRAPKHIIVPDEPGEEPSPTITLAFPSNVSIFPAADS